MLFSVCFLFVFCLFSVCFLCFHLLFIYFSFVCFFIFVCWFIVCLEFVCFFSFRLFVLVCFCCFAVCFDSHCLNVTGRYLGRATCVRTQRTCARPLSHLLLCSIFLFSGFWFLFRFCFCFRFPFVFCSLLSCVKHAPYVCAFPTCPPCVCVTVCDCVCACA